MEGELGSKSPEGQANEENDAKVAAFSVHRNPKNVDGKTSNISCVFGPKKWSRDDMRSS